MGRAGITLLGAIVLVGAAGVGQADKERCKVRIGDSGDFHFLDRTYTRGRCEQESLKYAASRVCESPGQRFKIRYRFDDAPYDIVGECRDFMGGEPPHSHDKERCKVKIGEDYHFLDRTYTRSRCEQASLKYAASRLCESHHQRFKIRYRFDDDPYEAVGDCGDYR